MMRLAVNDWQTWLVWQAQQSEPLATPIEVMTLSPGLYEALRDSASVTDISEPDLHKANALGEEVVGIALRWRDRLDELYAKDFGGRRAGQLLARGVPQLLSALCYHWLALSRCRRSAGEPVLVPFLPSQDHNDLPDPWPAVLTPQGLNYMALLAVEAQDETIRPLRLDPVNLDRRADYWPSGNATLPGVIDRMLNFGLWLAGPPPHILAFQLIKYLAGSGALSRARRGIARAEPRIVLMRSNNGNFLRAIPRMMFRRWPVAGVSLPSPAKDWRETAVNDRRLEGSLDADLAALPQEFHWLEVPLRAAARRIDAYVSGVLLTFHRAAEPKFKKQLGKAAGGRRAVVLTNGLYQPAENLAREYCHEAGVPVAAFQHGASGLVAHYETMLRFSDMKRADAYFCYTPYERDYFRGLGEPGARRFVVAGTDGVQNARLKGASGWMARLRWKVSRRPCLLYAPTQFKDGHVWLPHGIQDLPYWQFMRRMVFEVMGKLEQFDNVVKYHRKGLTSAMASPRARRRLEPLELIEMPDNVRTEYWPDLRYTRFAADMLIVDRATSTLGWLLHSRIPLVYVDTPFDPLLPEPREAIQEGLFYIDAAEPDWPERLRALLSRPLNELKEMWAEKAVARARLCEHYVLGPKVSNAEIARAIREVCAEGVPVR